MVKAKKNKKEIVPAEEVDSDVEVSENIEDYEDDGAAKTKGKSNKKKEDVEVSKVTKAVKKMSVQSKKKAEEEESDEEKTPQKAKKSAFDMLMGDDDDDDDVEEDERPQTPSEDEEEVKPKKNQKGNKKSKKAKRKNDSDDEDLDKVLAELQAEYSGQPVAAPVVATPEDIEEEVKSKKNKKKVEPSPEKDEEDEDNDGTVKTAAQKKKEKKERQKKEAAAAKLKAKTQPPAPKVEVPVVTEPEPVVEEKPEEEKPEDPESDKKNKKKKGKDKKAAPEEATEKKDTKKKGMSAAMVAAMQEKLKLIKEEEERMKKEEEERAKLEEEREQQRLEAIRLEKERKEKKKQKEAEKKARLKAEGKLLTKKQKEDRARAQNMLEALKAQGLDLPDPEERRPRPGTRVRNNKKKVNEQKEDEQKPDSQEESSKEATPVVEEKKEEIKDAWDASSDEEENSEETPAQETEKDNDEDDDEEDSDSSDEEDSESSEESEKENRNDPEFRKERAIQRIRKRREEAEKKRTLDDLRAAVVCVLGHVDTGKTKILDKLRRTNVQDAEAGGITQQIGATNVPIEAIKEQVKIVKGSSDFEHRLPGLLIIDTPGHESFSNLRNRGSSLCDIAILVVDIMHGLEPQTLESINLLKQKKCPFIVALNKIDRLYDWQTFQRRDIRDVIKGQQSNTQVEFQQRTKEVILQFAEQGLNAALFYENPDPRTYVSLVPTSAITGEGMGNLLYLIVESCQSLLPKRLMYSEELQAIVLEVKAIQGLGTTIDAILINGKLREGDTMIVAGTDGPIVTQIRSLLMPQPMKELRVKSAYVEHREIKAAQGVKIAAKDLEKAIAGINLVVANNADEVEIGREEVAGELKNALSHIKLKQLGVYVQASTLGSLEALLDFLGASKIPVSVFFLYTNIIKFRCIGRWKLPTH
ncbi:EIF5B family protein [Megaselia abdita]